ncbi:unnamed protein product [Urochloa decumbens]
MDGTKVEESISEGYFGLHDISQGSSFCVHNESLKHGPWIGGKDDWIVITNNRCSMNIVNLITGEKIPLPLLSTIQGVQISESEYLEVHPIGCCSRALRRVVLCQTPSSRSGYLALVLFDDGMLAYTSEGDKTWKLFTHRKAYLGCYHREPLIVMDAILHKGSVIAVDGDGFCYSWDIRYPEEYPMPLATPERVDIEGSVGCIFFLAKSPADELLIIGVHGHCHRARATGRLVVNEHDVLKHIDGVQLHKFEESHGTWERICNIGLGHSLFLGLNYPFYGSWNGIKPNCVYVADMGGNDVLTFALQADGEALIEKHDLPTEQGARLLDGHSMRTPMWFRPTLPSREK